MRSSIVRIIAYLLSMACVAQCVCAQTSLSGAYADGQVFLRWTLSPSPVFTYDIYASELPQSDISNMTLVGRLFPQEATGARLRSLGAGAVLRVPTGTGYVTLNQNEGAFAWTPHVAGSRFFAVVKRGDTAVASDNRVYVNFNYDPIREPVKPHLMFSATTQGGYPYSAYMVWVDGRVDPEDGRPDFPVMGNEHRNGVPHVFTVTSPLNGLSDGPYPMAFALHGGEGEYAVFMPGRPARANMSLELSDGIVVTPDDNMYWMSPDLLQLSVTTWFGYVSSFDPFVIGPRTNPPDDAIIVNYTSRRVFWIRDWLLSARSPFNVDSHRVSLIGHSAGSRGASHLSRQQPDRFAAVVIQSMLINFSDPAPVSPIRGLWSQNLVTNLADPLTGQPVTFHDVLLPYARLASARDFPYTRTYSGRHDDNDSGGWTPQGRTMLDAINASRKGIVVSWDDREHGVDLWSTDENDLVDDPAHCDPWPDSGHWTVPVKTERYSAQYLVNNFRNNWSYPGIFDTDANLNASGRQPDPGPGDPCSSVGDSWGTWGGFADWTRDSIVDLPSRWECTLFLRGNSAASVDNAPMSVEKISLAPRRTQRFNPPSGSTVYWALKIPAYGQIVQQGQVTVDSDGAAYISSLLIPRDDVATSRIYMSTTLCFADFNGDEIVDFFDYLDFVAEFSSNSPAADFNGDGIVDLFDYLDFVQAFSSGC